MNAITAMPRSEGAREVGPACDAVLPVPGPPLTSEVVWAEEAGERLVAAWRDLATDAAEPNSFAEHWFAAAGLRHLAGAREVRLLSAWRGDALVGIVPLQLLRRYGRVPLAHVQNWKHFNDFLGVPLIRAGFEQAFWTQVLATLDKAAWASGLLHINGLVENGSVLTGLADAADAVGRPCEIVHRLVRAHLASPLSADAYYADTVRKKKRKELGRLQRRLGELGNVATKTLGDGHDLDAWCDAFLALEHGGWKGRAGSSLASAPQTEAFFRDALAGALAAGRLDFRRMDLDGRPIAMLINFIAPPGSYSFKTAFDEAYAKFSPGVLIQLDNLSLMERDGVAWMDSCAAQDHPMIDSLWGERRSIVRVSVPLGGLRRRLEFKLARGLEDGSARLRRLLRAGQDRKAPQGGKETQDG